MPPRRQSAAGLPSLAPHGVRRGCWMNRIAGVHGEAMYTAPDCAARAALQAAICQCRGQGAAPLAFSWGIKRGAILSRERMAPFDRAPARCRDRSALSRCLLCCSAELHWLSGRLEPLQLIPAQIRRDRRKDLSVISIQKLHIARREQRQIDRIAVIRHKR